MGWYFVKQPNGLLARYSSIVDNFTHINLSNDDALDMCVNEYKLPDKDAKRKVQRGIDDCNIYSPQITGTGQDRWNESILMISEIHGEAAVKQLLVDISNNRRVI